MRMTAKGWVLFGLDVIVMFASAIAVVDVLVGDIATDLPPWQGATAIGTGAAFVAMTIRDFWVDRRPVVRRRVKPAPRPQTAGSGATPPVLEPAPIYLNGDRT